MPPGRRESLLEITRPINAEARTLVRAYAQLSKEKTNPMAFKSAIEWTDATWNPWHGCHKISAGCKNCYMFRDKTRYGQDPNTVVRSGDKTFYAPLKWKEPRLIFTCSWSDFFIEEADPWRDEAFAIMALTPQHTYQVLTKRPDRMYEYLRTPDRKRHIAVQVMSISNQMAKSARSHEGRIKLDHFNACFAGDGPFKNIWLGVSAEDRDTYITRVPYLAMTPASTKFLSFEPLLGDIGDLMLDGVFEGSYQWAIAGGESGPNARSTNPNWIRSIRDQSAAAGVAFHFKQWGEFIPLDQMKAAGLTASMVDLMNANTIGRGFLRVGKKKAGRLLDGREWNEMPEIAA